MSPAPKALVALPRLTLSVTRQLHACHYCRYWLLPEDEFCADCGARSMHPEATWRAPVLTRWRRGGGIGGAAIGLAGLVAGVPVVLGLLGVIPLAAVAGLLLGNEHAKSRLARQQRLERADDSLVRDERRTAAMITQCQEFIARISHSKQNVERVLPVGPERDTALRALAQAHAARIAQRDACKVRLWNVAFTRWGNALRPILDGLDTISFEEGDRRIAACEQLIAHANGLVAQWRDEPAAQTARGRRFLEVVRDALAHLESIRREVALRQSRLADPTATYLGAAPPPGVALVRELERFSDLASEIASGRYAQALEELEAEDARLTAELESSQLLADEAD